MRRPFRKLICGICLLGVLSVPTAAETIPGDQLINRAGRYLELLDQERFLEAWVAMSTIFKALGNQDQWLSRQRTIRSAYGPVASRHFYRIDYRQSYSLSPDGQYVIVQFKSSYQNKTETMETLVLDCRTAPDCSIREYIIR